MSTHYEFRPVGGMDAFYREAGPADAPVVPLLHGIRSASPVCGGLIPRLSGRYRRIAPDLSDSGPSHPDAEPNLLDRGYFAVETHVEEIAALLRDVRDRVLPMERGAP